MDTSGGIGKREAEPGMAKILIIDDEIDARDLLARLLTKNGYEVVAAADILLIYQSFPSIP